MENLVNALLIVHGERRDTEYPTTLSEEIQKENLVCNSEDPSMEVKSTLITSKNFRKFSGDSDTVAIAKVSDAASTPAKVWLLVPEFAGRWVP